MIKSLSKKFIIKGVATTLVALLPFSIIKPYYEPKAIVGVDDAILIATLGTLAVGGTLACYGISKSGIIEKTASSIGDGLQDIGNGWKTIENGKAMAKSLISILPKVLDTSKSLEGTEIQDNILNLNIVNDYYQYPFNVSGDGKTKMFSISVFSPSLVTFPVYDIDNNYVGKLELNPNLTSPVNILYEKQSYGYDLYCSYTDVYLDGSLSTSPTLQTGINYILNIPKSYNPVNSYIYPTLTDVENPPTSISLEKSKVEMIATDYAEKYPSDNNGDKKVNYVDLIPFVLDMLSKDLGDGTITPQNLSNNGIVSYVYKDGQTQGMYPYNFQDLGEHNINVNQNVTIGNGNEVSEEEKNGILNILDNGVRKTTTLLNNLKNSMSNLGNTLKGLFDLLPEPVGYLFYSALCLTLIFFILSLRR